MPFVISEKLVTTFSIKIYIRERSIPYTFIWGTHQALKTFEQYYIVSTIVLLLTKHLCNTLIYLGSEYSVVTRLYYICVQSSLLFLPTRTYVMQQYWVIYEILLYNL